MSESNVDQEMRQAYLDAMRALTELVSNTKQVFNQPSQDVIRDVVVKDCHIDSRVDKRTAKAVQSLAEAALANAEAIKAAAEIAGSPALHIGTKK